ncbi:uncharacterized protein MYCGRDRAFT_91969 [Zymoseptoria tritici IPO323]|uniref:HORMA domain-containing protein n=1 Tax=Zymoseptoria tritici (strain CBS 115943 / IPO323) TaxID=336722 RepID=F9X568_ZYMTI|nr:uncharacterized protein MYCGRDRAFT_91969 [Zymoseptoria tritici IPO323]EGP88974.1 hypothetical protein MYCGRDRAFT_91969 [Zymoseptoria tritici IPO323]
MPSVQMQKTRPAPPVTKTRLTQKQSQEIVQTLLLGGLSTLTWTREFFAEKVFTSQFYPNHDRIPSYKDVSNGKLPQKKSALPGTSMQVLQRHRSKRADLFLDWLEQGAFPALKQGTLHAVQVCVHLNSDDREQVVETYTFTIKYHTDESSGETLAGLEVDGPKGDPLTLEATSEAMQKMIRGITKLTEKLPGLPGATTLKVSYLHDPALSDIVPSTYPTKLGYGDPISAQADIDISLPQEADAETVVSQTPKERQVSLPSTLGSDRGVDRLITQMETPLPTAAMAANRKDSESPALSERDANTQSSVVPRMKSALGGMMLPEHLTQGDTQTQMPMRRPTAAARTISRVPNSPIEKEMSTAREDSLKQQPPVTTKMMLLPKLANLLEAKKSKLRKTALSLSQSTNTDADKEERVLCQCGLARDAGDMVNCVHCDTWQHIHCYGFSGSKDPRLPDEHTCYQCLLGGMDEDLLTKMEDLALLRRGMGIVLHDGLQRKTDLGKLMGERHSEAHLPAQSIDRQIGISPSTAQTLHTRLRSYVVNARGSHKPGFAATGNAPWVPAPPGHPNHDLMLRELFDPLRHIEHCYATQPAVTKPIVEQLLALRSGAMPPPSTPASVFNKKHASATPADGLDLRPSMSPFTTPLRVPTGKRGRDEDEEIFDTPAKRQASTTPLYHRLKSVQSQYILNADGKSSSPAGRGD